MKNPQASLDDKFGMLIHKGRVLAKYGNVSRVSTLIKDIESNENFQRYQKLFGKDCKAIKVDSDKDVSYLGLKRVNNTASQSLMMTVYPETPFNLYTAFTVDNVNQDVNVYHAKFSGYKLTEFTYRNLDSMDTALYTEEMFATAIKDGVYNEETSRRGANAHVFWIAYKKSEPE